MSQVNNLSKYQPISYIVMTDTNVMIQYFDSSHKFYKNVRKSLRSSVEKGVHFYYPEFCLREFREYFRKLYIKNFLIGYIRSHSLGLEVENKIKLIQNQNRIGDKDFKDLRDLLEKTYPGKGYKLWFKICAQALKGKFEILENMIQSCNFLILKLNDSDFFGKNSPNLNKEITFTNKFGLGVIDSALISWFECSENIDALITNDHDLLIAQENGAVPNRIFLTTILTY
ncbi:MAG: hypothetical protein KDD45_10775 [Bdellovibrionales bacterium]|nr:hypothetical protein [Bdellovibrionales bacterium]